MTRAHDLCSQHPERAKDALVNDGRPSCCRTVPPSQRRLHREGHGEALLSEKRGVGGIGYSSPAKEAGFGMGRVRECESLRSPNFNRPSSLCSIRSKQLSTFTANPLQNPSSHWGFRRGNKHGTAVVSFLFVVPAYCTVVANPRETDSSGCCFTWH